MKRVQPNTFMLTLPNGEKVRCWRKDAEAIRLDVQRTGTVRLVRDALSEVYDRVDAVDVASPELAPFVRRVG